MITPERIAQIRAKPHGPTVDEPCDTIEALSQQPKNAAENLFALIAAAEESMRIGMEPIRKFHESLREAAINLANPQGRWDRKIKAQAVEIQRLRGKLEAALKDCQSKRQRAERAEVERDRMPALANSEALSALLAAKREWSERSFGLGLLTDSIVAHIRKELAEIEVAPEDTAEHVDVILLAMDLYWRAGGRNLLADLWAKLRTNQAREWQTSGDGAVEHVR